MPMDVTEFARRQTQIGQHAQMRRTYQNTDMQTTWANTPSKNDADNNWHSAYSWTASPTGLVDFAAGAKDAAFISQIKSIPKFMANGQTFHVEWGLQHEWNVKVNSMGYTAAQFNNAAAHLRVVVDQMAAQGVEQITSGRVRFVGCMIATYWGVQHSMDAGLAEMDIINSDAYAMGGNQFPDTLLAPYINELATTFGGNYPGGVWEAGTVEGGSGAGGLTGADFKQEWLHRMNQLAFNQQWTSCLLWDAGKAGDDIINTNNKNMFTRQRFMDQEGLDIIAFGEGNVSLPPAPVIITPTEDQVFAAGTSPITIRGTTGGASQTVEVFNANNVLLGGAIEDGAGNWTFDRLGQTTGSYGVSAQATRPTDGVQSLKSTVRHYTVGTVTAAPTIQTPTDGAVFASGTTPIVVSGSAATGSLVTLKNASDVTIATTTAAGGSWTINRTSLTDGDYTMRATATVGGVESQASLDVSFHVGSVSVPPEGRPIGGQFSYVQWGV